MWTVPAVTVAVAAPAYATSHLGPSVDDATAAYEGGTSPEVLNVNVQMTSTEPISSLSLHLPPRLFDSVESSEPATITGSRDGGWTVLVPTPDRSLYTALTFGSTEASPWLGLRATDFVLTAVATSGAHTSDAFPVPVAYGGLSVLEVPTIGAAWQEQTVLAVSAGDILLDPDDQKAVGRLRVAVRLPTAADGDTTPPSVVEGSHPGWIPDPTYQPQPGTFAGDWVFRFVTTQEAHTATTGVASDRGPGTFTARFDVAGADLVVDREAYVHLDVTSLESEFEGWSAGDSKVEARSARTPMPAPPA